MTTPPPVPIPVLTYGVRQKRRDYCGIVSLPFSVFYLVWFIGGVPIANPSLGNLLDIVLGVWPMVIALAIVGIALMRGKSIAGWTAIAIYGAMLMIRLLGMR